MEEVDDGLPRFGMLLISMDCRRQGYGSEVLQRLLELFRAEYQWPLLRAWVAEENEGGRAFAQHLGFHEVEKQMARLAGGMQQIVRLDYYL